MYEDDDVVVCTEDYTRSSSFFDDDLYPYDLEEEKIIDNYEREHE